MTVKIDLHVHTNYSACAAIQPNDIEKIALQQGLDGVAITDHNTISGALEVRAAAQSIKVIVAEEIDTKQGELIGYFLQEQIPPGLTPRETIAEIHKQGGIVSVPHPFDNLRSSRITKEALADILGEIDMIEVFNARDIVTVKDQQLLSEALQKGVIPVASSDAHLRIEIGRSYVVMEDFTTPDEFLRNLSQSRQVTRKSPFWVHLVTKFMRTYKKIKAER